MGAGNGETEKAILEAGRREFLEKGYEKASMRRIAGNAGVTTGAIYGCYPGKEALFDALTEEDAQGLLKWYRRVHQEFLSYTGEEQRDRMGDITRTELPKVIHYIYDHYSAFKLLVCCAPEGRREEFFDELASVEEESTRHFLNTMGEMGASVPEIDDMLLHILCRSFFKQIEEFILHDVTREKALACTSILNRFQDAGWMELIWGGKGVPVR